MEVVTRAAAKLSLDWPAECPVEPEGVKLDERFLRFKTAFFPPISTLRCRGCGGNLSRPASSSPHRITTVM